MSVGVGSEIPTTMPVSMAATLIVDGSGVTQPVSIAATVTTKTSYGYANIATNTTTTVKSGAGVLHTLVINTRGGTSSATVYDNTAGSGTKIATIDTTLSTTAFVYDVAFTTGLTIVTAGVSAADLTVSYL